MAKKIKELGIKRVVILAGAHMPTCLDESMRYINEITEFLEKKGLVVDHRLGNSPDDDIGYVLNSHAGFYVSTQDGEHTGYYGKLLKELLRSNGGNIIENI